jgi:hypothetical protein
MDENFVLYPVVRILIIPHFSHYVSLDSLLAITSHGCTKSMKWINYLFAREVTLGLRAEEVIIKIGSISLRSFSRAS